ncbi:MAG: hypothetical protein JXA66_01910 [Oligoflexia bacterium]|nr:hypothetical protein [Oligoflexia bacterium]
MVLTVKFSGIMLAASVIYIPLLQADCYTTSPQSRSFLAPASITRTGFLRDLSDEKYQLFVRSVSDRKILSPYTAVQENVNSLLVSKALHYVLMQTTWDKTGKDFEYRDTHPVVQYHNAQHWKELLEFVSMLFKSKNLPLHENTDSLRLTRISHRFSTADANCLSYFASKC